MNPLFALSLPESFQDCQSFSLRAENPGHSEPGFNFSSKRGIWVSASPSLGKRRNKHSMVDFSHSNTFPSPRIFFFSQAISVTLLWKSFVRMVGKQKGAFEPLRPGDAKLQPSLPRLKEAGIS